MGRRASTSWRAGPSARHGATLTATVSRPGAVGRYRGGKCASPDPPAPPHARGPGRPARRTGTAARTPPRSVSTSGRTWGWSAAIRAVPATNAWTIAARTSPRATSASPQAAPASRSARRRQPGSRPAGTPDRRCSAMRAAALHGEELGLPVGRRSAYRRPAAPLAPSHVGESRVLRHDAPAGRRC
jgi:hypothetical protein